MAAQSQTPKGGHRAYMGPGMWGKCAPGHPMSLVWCSGSHLVTARYMLYSIPLGDGTACTGRLSSTNKGRWVTTPSNR